MTSTSTSSWLSPPPSTVVISRPALIKSFVLLILIWVVAAFTTLGTGPTVSSNNNNNNNNDAAQEKPNKYGVQNRPHVHDENDAKASQLAASTAAARHTDRAAVIIENRPLENLVPVMLHFHAVLGPEWPVILYTTPTTSMALEESSSAFGRAVDAGRIEVRLLPATANFDSHHAVSQFLTSPWLWTDLDPYAKVLMFQTDSILCAAADEHVDDFMEWDLVGAPIAAAHGQGYNGGLSLRDRATVLEVLDHFSFEGDGAAHEDQWLFGRMRVLPAGADGTPRARLPDEETARRFAVETVWAERPLGFHQPVRWQKDKMERIMEYCPEVGMIGGGNFF